MSRPVHNKLKLYFSPLCIFGQVARGLCEEYYKSQNERSTDKGGVPVINSAAIDLVEVPLGLPVPGVQTVYRQTPTLVIDTLVIEDYRMIWYELYGRYLTPVCHASERAILDKRTYELFHSVIIPILTSPAGRKAVRNSCESSSCSSNSAQGSFFYRYWTAPLLLHRLRRKSENLSRQNNREAEPEISINSTSALLAESKTAQIIERAAEMVLHRLSLPSQPGELRVINSPA